MSRSQKLFNDAGDAGISGLLDLPQLTGWASESVLPAFVFPVRVISFVDIAAVNAQVLATIN